MANNSELVLINNTGYDLVIQNVLNMVFTLSVCVFGCLAWYGKHSQGLHNYYWWKWGMRTLKFTSNKHKYTKSRVHKMLQYIVISAIKVGVW